jgi:outer membrane receptor protein involved in Fe transport
MNPIARLLVVILMSVAAFAQTARITGQVTDASTAAVPSARISITNSDTGIQWNAQTNEQGYFTLPALPRGNYNLTVEAAGFRPVNQKGLNLDEGQVLRRDIQLEVGQNVEAVEVVAEALQLERETSDLNTVVPKQRVLDLPLNGRNPLSLANLVPGVRPVGGFGGLTVSAFGDGRISIAGGGPSVNNVMVDGAGAENHTSGGLQVALSTDATEEFRIITRNASAEYGRTGGGVINLISRSGTNNFHGSLFHFLRNKSITANDFFSNLAGRARVPFSFNQFGVAVGGPIRRNQTFFFFNWEMAKERRVARSFFTVPTALQGRGDFSQTRDAANRLFLIHDPSTTRVNPADPSRRIRDPFPGNVIPTGRLSPVALAVNAYFPQPNVPGDPGTGANNLFGNSNQNTDKAVAGLKLDHYFSSTRRIAGRYTWDDTNLLWPAYFGANLADPGTSPTQYPRNSGVLTYIDTLRSNLLLEARVGVNRFGIARVTRSQGFDVSQIRMNPNINSLVQVRAFPRFDIGDLTSIGANQGDVASQSNNSGTAAAALTWTRGKHTVKTGFEYRIYQWNSEQGNGLFSMAFNRNFTHGPDPNTAANNGFGFASYMLGLPASGVIHRYPTPTYSTNYYGAFVQDDWKVNPKLTLNLGFRYEYEAAATDRFNAISNFNPNLETRAGNLTLRGGLVFPGVNGLPRGNRDAGLTDFGPRIGLSYQVLPRTVVRASYGIFYLPTTGIYIRLGSTGFASATPYVASVDGGFTPANTMSDPYPQGIIQPSGSTLGGLTGLGGAIEGNLRSLTRGYSQQWNFNVQRELPGGWIVELGYMGNRGVHLPATRDFDYLPAAARALGTDLQTLVDNPFAAIIPSGPLSQPRVTRATLLDTLPQFTAGSGLDNWASSIYHAGTVRVERRFAAGLSLLGSYTFSKLIDNNLGNGSNGFIDSGSNGVQNWDNLRAERAVSASDQPHRLVLTASYLLPFAKSGPLAYRLAAGGWQINTIASFLAGNVIAVTANAPAFGGNRPNVVGDPDEGERNIDRWLNRNAFANIAPFTFGNAPRHLPRTRSGGQTNFDISLLKDFPLIREAWKLQFRAEAFNATNTPSFGNPQANINSAQFGQVRSLRVNTGPRTLQFALKLYF